jgi:predicted GNAT family acetyltransferase
MSFQIKVYDNAKSFWDDVSPHLKVEETKNSLLLGLSYTFLSDPSGRVYQAALSDDRGFCGAVVCSRYLTNQNLLPSLLKNKDEAKHLFRAVQEAGVEITSVVGELGTANFFRDLFHESGKKTKTHMTQGIYRCAKVKMPGIPSDFDFRLAESKDIEKIAEWIEAFHREAVPHDPPMNGRDHAQAKISRKTLYVMERKGELLSMAAWTRDIGSSCSINFVFTPKHLRKNGYGSMVTGLLTQHKLDGGKRETSLYTDMSNPTSNKIYRNIGYEFVCNSTHFGIV